MREIKKLVLGIVITTFWLFFAFFTGGIFSVLIAENFFSQGTWSFAILAGSIFVAYVLIVVFIVIPESLRYVKEVEVE